MFKLYRKLISYVPEKTYLLGLTVLLSVLSTLAQVGAMYYLYIFLNKLIFPDLPKTTGIFSFDSAAEVASVLVGLMFFGAICYTLSVMCSHSFAFRLETNMRKYGIDGLTRASHKFFDRNESGKIRKLIDDNAALTHSAVAHLIPDNTGAMLMPILIIALAFAISIRLGITMIIFTIIILIILKNMMGEKKFMEFYQNSLDKMSAETVEYVRGMQVVKIFNVDVISYKSLYEAIKTYGKYAYEYSMSCRRPYVLFQVISFGIIAFITPIVVLVPQFTRNPGSAAVELTMLLFLTGVIYVYIMKIMYISMFMFQAQTAVNKLETLYDEMQEDKVSYGTRTDFCPGDIRFEHVDFSYGDIPVLNDFSLDFKQGKTYALVGESGSGKSTIAKLISGFYPLNAGRILIGDTELSEYSRDTIVKNIAMVFQNPQLFKKSIYENVAMARKNATGEEVLKALELAGCNDILSKFSDREKTVIGTEGVYLSGGEKQRVAIARAILKDAPIVIFDEASASVDPESEHELQKAFANLMKGKTVIMIAHRLSSITNVDEIFVMDKGKVAERGTHKELMGRGGIYKGLQTMYREANDWRVSDEKLA
ncbi:MAG: ABC transporter ATP-binding protein [Clostridiales bacterium]|nr:ABC transporter ATP-binding protein [Clostridiales bacterium]MDY4060220.1 ABC transporter ATP-binding protein [Anaerovoracaceae bacterium]